MYDKIKNNSPCSILRVSDVSIGSFIFNIKLLANKGDNLIRR